MGKPPQLTADSATLLILVQEKCCSSTAEMIFVESTLLNSQLMTSTCFMSCMHFNTLGGMTGVLITPHNAHTSELLHLNQYLHGDHRMTPVAMIHPCISAAVAKGNKACKTAAQHVDMRADR